MPFGASALGCCLVPEDVGHTGPEFTVDICGVTGPVGTTQPSLRADLEEWPLLPPWAMFALLRCESAACGQQVSRPFFCQT